MDSRGFRRGAVEVYKYRRINGRDVAYRDGMFSKNARSETENDTYHEKVIAMTKILLFFEKGIVF